MAPLYRNPAEAPQPRTAATGTGIDRDCLASGADPSAALKSGSAADKSKPFHSFSTVPSDETRRPQRPLRSSSGKALSH